MLIVSPVTGEIIAEVADDGPAKVAEAIAKAARTFADLQEIPLFERCDRLRRTADALEHRREQLVRNLSLEHGKTLIQAGEELDAAAHGLRMTAEYARRLEGSTIPVGDPAKRVFTRREPLGVVGVITPWNFPLAIPVEYIAPALAAGNTVVWKGAESTPLSSAALRAAFDEAGWPEGALVSLVGGPATGAALVRSSGLSAMCFTGSAEVGAEIAAEGGLRRLVLELGGNGPTIVFADADLEAAAGRIAAGSYYASGQTCTATERILVERSASQAFLDALVARTEAEQLGDPFDDKTTIGPIHLDQTAEKVKAHIDDAVTKGARAIGDGGPVEGFPTRRYFQPTVLADVTPAMRIFTEETFGPVAPITAFHSEREAAELAALGSWGLAGAVFTRDIERAFAVAEWLRVGQVVVNDTSDYWEMHLPFGGAPGTRSGIGRVGGAYALEHLSAVKSMIVDVGRPTPSPRDQ
jgi:succinate-semialdehyde dehydrogenase/glutarate-semialdehyde dehydrogenase